MRNDYIVGDGISYLCITDNKEQSTVLFTIETEVIPQIQDYRWYLHRKKGVPVYAATRSNGNKYIMLHRLINQTDAGLATDHINGDTFDNRKCNLRSVTTSQNGLGCRKLPLNKSGYRGVYQHKMTGKWEARITVNSKDIYMGLFKDKHVAGAVCSQKIMEVCRDWLSQAPEYTI